MNKFNNICLIGLPYAGKSRLGKLFSMKYRMGFIETDLMIKNKYNKELKDIIKYDGINNFLDYEKNISKIIHCENTIISTGGSMVYHNDSMNFFKYNLSCKVIHLYLTFDEFKNRIDDLDKRGVINTNNLDIYDLYYERIYLCNKYSDININVDDINKIIMELNKKK
jgi:shikimate kinase